jgi:hypothetical protein
MTSNAAMTRHFNFNPAEYKHEAARLAKHRPELAADAMTQVATKMNAAEAEVEGAQNTTKSIVSGLVASSAMIGVGYWNGASKARADAMVADWIEGGAADVGADLEQYPAPWDHPEGMKDPTLILGFAPKMLVSSLAFGLLSVSIAAMTRRKLIDPVTGEVELDVNGKPKYDPTYENLGARMFRDLAFLNLGYWAADFGASRGAMRTIKKLNADTDVAPPVAA